MILVTGATGKVGSEAVRRLRQQDAHVRALVRDPRKAEGLAAVGAEIAVGDFDDRASLQAATDGVTCVVLTSAGGEPGQELNVVDAAARAQVGHVVKLTSKASPDSPIARQRWHAQIEQGLTASGLTHTLLRSNAFMQNTLMSAPGIAKTHSFSSSVGAGRIGMCDARDVGAAAAAIAVEPTRHAGKTYWLSGPELLSYKDVAAILSRVLGRTVTFRPRSRQEDETEMVNAGLPGPVAAMNALAMSMFAEGDAEWLSQDMPTLLGRPTRTYEQFAADHAVAFSS